MFSKTPKYLETSLIYLMWNFLDCYHKRFFFFKKGTSFYQIFCYFCYLIYNLYVAMSKVVCVIGIFDWFSMPSIIFTQLERNFPSNWSTTLRYSSLFLPLCYISLPEHIHVFIDGSSTHVYTLVI